MANEAAISLMPSRKRVVRLPRPGTGGLFIYTGFPAKSAETNFLAAF
jgi:hypothetical protein